MYFCPKQIDMQDDNTPKNGSEYDFWNKVWNKGNPEPLEQERIVTFVWSCIESVAERLACSVTEVYCRLERAGLINDYIVPFYDKLSAESSEDITTELIEVLELWEQD